MTYISTDYVFDGQGTEPWKPDCKEYAPLNVYGKTKLEGELAVSETLEKYFIVRIAWVFGLNGNNFIKTMLKVGKNHDTVRVVNDQIGTPTYTYDLARLLVDMSESEKYGYYHATNEGGYISWYDFTKEIYRQAGYTTEVLPVTTAEYGLSKAARPFNSRLEKESIYNAVANYYERTFKNTNECMAFRGNFFRQLTEVNNVEIIGHSFGEVDMPYFIYLKYCISKNAKWKFYYHSLEDYNAAEEAVKELELDIGDYEILPSDCFWQ